MDANMSDQDVYSLKDEVVMLKDKIAHLQSRLEESESEAIMAAELGQRLLEEKGMLESARDENRMSYTAKIEELTQDNFNLNAKLSSKIKLLEIQSQEHDDQQKKQENIDKERENVTSTFEKKLNDLKKEKLATDDELGQLNLKLQQKCEIIDNLHKVIEEQKSKYKVVQSNVNLDREMQELKNALQSCYEEKCDAEGQVEGLVHDSQRKNLEVETLKKRICELNDELEYSKKELSDCYKHIEDGKNTMTELRVEINGLETELNSRGHSRKGNSLFGELEDKRVAAERNLAIFKVRYNSLQKSHTSAREEITRMKYQVLAFLQSRNAKADELRIEHLEQSLSSVKVDFNVLAAKLRQKEEQQKTSIDPLKEIREQMKVHSGPESSKHYVNFLLVNAEEYKSKIESLQNELKLVRLANIAKCDELQETQRKLYTAMNSAERNRNEEIKAKLKLEQMSTEFETEKRKRGELEALVKQISNDGMSASNQPIVEKFDEEKTVAKKPHKEAEDKKKRKIKYEAKESDVSSVAEQQADDVFSFSENTVVVADKSREMTAEERREKCIRVLRNVLPEELANEYVKRFENNDKKPDRKESRNIEKWSARARKRTANERKVSFKDEVDYLEAAENAADAVMAEEPKTTFKPEKEKTQVVYANKDDNCHVQ